MSDPTPPPAAADDETQFGEAIFDDEVPEEVAARAPLTVKRVAIVGARVVTGVVGLGVAIVTIGASVLLPLPTVSSTPPSVLVTPVPTAQQLVCGGAVLRLSDDTGQEATTSSAIGRPVTQSASSSGAVDSHPLELSDASTGGTPAAPLVISTPPNPADPTEVILLSGAQSQQVNEGDFVGLAAAGCGAVSGDSWLAGGSTAVGRTTLVTLSNPTEVAATVDLELFGEGGAIKAPGTSGIVVPANGQRVLSLAGFAPDEVAPVVHVMSSGGQVTAELQQSTVRGLQPGGIDIVGPTGSPSLENVIPGLRVTDIVAVQELLVGGPTFEDLEAVLRLFAPGEGSVSATISIVPEDGIGAGSSFVFDIAAGRVVDVPIGELENGAYTVRVVSSVPTVAAVRVSSAAPSGAVTDAPATDFAWLTAAPELSERAQVTVAAGPDPMLHFANPTTAALVVTVTGNGGETVTVDVPAGASASIPAEPSVTYTLSGFDTLFASVTLAGEGMIARYAVQPAG
ncbi:MAG: DUF5719 family protein, partial [Rhodoglobus sp.]|nr:DUF5719 family protein [Rhodoglobus sp.]